jgi:thiamine biosynthesis lipoprotein
MERHEFHAMGTTVECLLDGEPRDGLLRVEAEFERLEALLSRFRPDSELSQLNRAGRFEAGPDLLRVTRMALDARERSGGLFDPSVLDAVVAAGYDRSFELLPADGPATNGVARCGGGVRILGRLIELEPRTHLDLGGIAKGYAVDRAVELLAAYGPCLVNAGGDLAVRGGSWPIGVDGSVTLELSSGAIATSGRDRRRWSRGGEERHHLIDPATGRPAETGLLRVTVVASTAAEAEVLAKIAFLGGNVDVPRVLVTADGRAILEGGLG